MKNITLLQYLIVGLSSLMGFWFIYMSWGVFAKQEPLQQFGWIIVSTEISIAYLFTLLVVGGFSRLYSKEVSNTFFRSAKWSLLILLGSVILGAVIAN